jgi:hypothetical protein
MPALDHPITGEQVLAFVTYGAASCATSGAAAAVTFRSSWAWAAVEGMPN